MKYNYIIILLTIFNLGCSQASLTDGTYCASVDRYNPKTQKESNYTLTVEVKDRKIIQMNYPNGGHTDSEQFKPPTIENKSTSFSDYRGVQFSVDILKGGEDCFSNVAKAYQCTGKTKKGTRCKNKTDNKSGKCWKHG